jgi:magnesium transporter
MPCATWTPACSANRRPDITGVTFIIAPKTLVTVRYHPVESFNVFAQKLCKAPGLALFPDAVAVGLINTVLNRSARALSKSGEGLDRIASAVFRAKGDQSRRSQIYSDTLNALGREDEKISNLRESMVSTRRSPCGRQRSPRYVTCSRSRRTRASRRRKCSSCSTRHSASSTCPE